MRLKIIMHSLKHDLHETQWCFTAQLMGKNFRMISYIFSDQFCLRRNRYVVCTSTVVNNQQGLSRIAVLRVNVLCFVEFLPNKDAQKMRQNVGIVCFRSIMDPIASVGDLGVHLELTCRCRPTRTCFGLSVLASAS